MIVVNVAPYFPKIGGSLYCTSQRTNTASRLFLLIDTIRTRLSPNDLPLLINQKGECFLMQTYSYLKETATRAR